MTPALAKSEESQGFAAGFVGGRGRAALACAGKGSGGGMGRAARAAAAASAWACLSAMALRTALALASSSYAWICSGIHFGKCRNTAMPTGYLSSSGIAGRQRHPCSGMIKPGQDLRTLPAR